jgi:hypothetical protein
MAADNNDSGIEKKTQMGLPFTKKKDEDFRQHA